MQTETKNIILLNFLYIPSKTWFRTLRNWWYKENSKISSPMDGTGVLYFPDQYVVAIFKQDIHLGYYYYLLTFNHIIVEFEAKIYPF
jgi:hypothetical protein